MIFLKRIALFLLAPVLFSATACGLPVDNLVQQPESPLIPGTNTTLAGYYWRLVNVTHQGENIEFNAIQPVIIHFANHGHLSLGTGCNGGGYRILSNDGRMYVLTGGEFTAQDCGEMADSQMGHVTKALTDTRRYEIRDNTLYLLGEDTRLVLEIESPFPPIPNAASPLAQNRWRLVKATRRSEAIPFDAIQPVSLKFFLGGHLIISTADCIDGSYHILAEDDRQYQLIPGEFSEEKCEYPGEMQFAQLADALAASTAYELHGDRLFLTGEDVRLVLEPENPAE